MNGVAIARLFCSPSNPRRNDEAVPHVESSIRRFGWQQPIVARPSGEVIAGNTRDPGVRVYRNLSASGTFGRRG